MASTAVPRGSPARSSGCTSSSLDPSSLPFFWVETTLPTTRAMSMSAHVPMVHDADDGGVGRDLRGQEGEGGLAAAHVEDLLADPRPHGVHRHQGRARDGAVGA